MFNQLTKKEKINMNKKNKKLRQKLRRQERLKSEQENNIVGMINYKHNRKMIKYVGNKATGRRKLNFYHMLNRCGGAHA